MSKINGVAWKSKAIQRSSDIRVLKRQLKEVKISRDSWKCKYQQLKEDQAVLRNKPIGHHYATSLIWLCIYVYNHSHCSFRSCCTMISSCAMLLKINSNKPSASSIRNWVIKSGYYAYTQPPPTAQKWCVIIDESVSIGQEKLLLILGIPLDNWQFTKALEQKDATVLHIGIASSWKSDSIATILTGIASKIKVAYCVSDKGNNINAAIKLLGWAHIYDCSHQWARCLEICYGKDEVFGLLMKQMATLRKKWILSKHAALMPPAQRTKARFQNIFPLIEWIEKIEKHWDNIDLGAQQELSFLKEHKVLISDLITLKNVINKMSINLKTKGLNSNTLKQCELLLQECCASKTTCQFRQLLQNDWMKYKSIVITDDTNFIASSDIIESYFGKFKQKIKLNGMQAITETVLTMGMWKQDITPDKIEAALQTIKIAEINEWKDQNTTPSLLKKRRYFFTQKSKKQAA